MDIEFINMKTQTKKPNSSSTKLDTKKSVLHLFFKKDGGGSYKQRDEATSNGLEIPTHRFVNETPSICITDITKDEAVTIMQYYNTNNRLLNKSWTQAYAAEFLANDWILTGDALKFADSNASVPHCVLDGQHRLAGFILACEQCDKEDKTYPQFRTAVVSGMDSDTQAKMDRNLKRTLAALYQFSDNSATNTLAFRLARNWMKWDLVTEVANVVSDRDISKAFNLYGEAINKTAQKFNRGINKTKNIGVFLACAKYLHYNPDKGEQFIERLLDGANLVKGSPILALRNYVGSTRNSVSGGQHYYQLSMKKAFNAIKKWHNGETIKNLVEFKGAVPMIPWQDLVEKKVDNPQVQ
jgi:hypothetical protein